MQRRTVERIPALLLLSLAIAALVILLTGARPYNLDAELIMGGPLRLAQGDNPYSQRFVYPLWIAVAWLPVAWLPDVVREQAWFLANLIIMTGSGAVIALASGGFRPPFQTAVLLAALLLYPPALWAVNTGQPEGLLLLGIALYLASLRWGSLWLAGAALAMLTAKPQLGAPVMAVLLLRHVRAREWQAIQGWTAALAVLAGLSFAVRPSWLGEWVQALTVYLSGTTTFASLGARLILTDSPAFYWAGAALGLAALLAWGYWGRTDPPVMASIAVMAWLVISPISHTYDVALLLMPLAAAMGRTRGSLPFHLLLAATYIYAACWKIAAWPESSLLFPSLVLTAGVLALCSGRPLGGPRSV